MSRSRLDAGKELMGAPTGQSARRRGLARRVAPLLGAGLLASCGALVGDQATVGGETHFLVSCEAGCGPGLSCFGGVCTHSCEVGDGSCAELGANAVCVSLPPPEDPYEVPAFTATCDARCEQDADCGALGADHTCRDGLCRATAPSARAPETGSAGQALVNAVAADTCISGLRWAGEDAASSEMLPGSDCVGCHRDTGARPLMLGGTVYPIHFGRSRNPPPMLNCFGSEGALVTITDAVGHVYTTRTNRAGNFYFEGSDADLVTPYSASVSTTFDGEEFNPIMASVVSYGGCARCHGSSADPVPFNLVAEDPSYVQPTRVIYTTEPSPE